LPNPNTSPTSRLQWGKRQNIFLNWH
jgi:hypothetical protein